MKAVQLLAPTELAVVDRDVPEVGPGQVLLRMLAAGVCQTDVHMARTTEGFAPVGTVLGHETAGEVVAVGAGVAGWAPGTTAVVHPVWACGACAACAGGRQNACRGFGQRLVPAPTPGVSAGVHGGMAEYLAVPASALVEAGGLDPATAATLTDAALTPYHSIRATRALLGPGSTAVVIGAGGLGRMAVQILRALTAARVVVLDVRTTAVAAVADQVDLALAGDDPGVAGTVLGATGGFGAEVVLDFVGTDDTLALAAAVVAPGGAVRAIGLAEGRFTFETGQASTSLPWGASLTRPYSGTYADLAAVVALARTGHLTPSVQRFPLERAPEVFDRLEAGELTGRGVLVPGSR